MALNWTNIDDAARKLAAPIAVATLMGEYPATEDALNVVRSVMSDDYDPSDEDYRAVVERANTIYPGRTVSYREGNFVIERT
ncbi:MAG TPA: hypothetical protein VD907_03330 [Verrucomicrobiae bacterium]|nr:hypothetical protein [Verrucomicrobiae bacterium]